MFMFDFYFLWSDNKDLGLLDTVAADIVQFQ